MALRVVDNKKKRKLSVSQPKIRTGNLSVVKTKANPYPQQRISVARGPRDIPSTRPRGFLGQTLYPAVGGAVRTIANVIPSAVQAVGNNLERGRLIDIPNAVPGIGMLDDAFYNTSAGRKFQNVTAGVTRNVGANIRAFGNEMTDILDQKRSESRFRPGVSGENRLLTNLGEGAGSLGAAAAVTYATGNTGAAAGVFGLQAGAQQIRQARDAGMSPQAAQNIGIAAGATEAALEKVGLDIMLRNNPATSTIRNTITKAVSEGLQEFSQSISQSAYSDIYKDVDYSDAVAQALQEGGIGAILGGGVGGVQSGINTAQAQQIKNNVKRYAQEGVVNKVANDVNAEILQIRDHIRNLDLAYDKMKREGFSENHQAVKDNRAEKIRWTQELNRVFQKAQNLNRINVVNQKPLGLTLGGPLAADFNQQQAAGRVFEGVDGKPRFEVDDSGAKIKNPNGKTLGEVLDHKKLYEQYPNMKDVKVQIDPTMKGNGEYSPWDNSIKVKSAEDIKTLLHETQHGIQTIEGFSSGANPDVGLSKLKRNRDLVRNSQEYQEWKQKRDKFLNDSTLTTEQKNNTMMQMEENLPNAVKTFRELSDQILKIQLDGNKNYFNQAGEAEARAVAARMNMSDGERYKNDPLQKAASKYKTVDDFINSAEKSTWGNYLTVEAEVPIDLIQSAEPSTASQKGFKPGRKVTEPVEIIQNLDPEAKQVYGEYLLLDGNHRLEQARLNGQKTITARLGITDQTVDGENPSTDIELLTKAYNEAKLRSTFYDSLDVPKEDLIIRDGGGKAMSVDSDSELLLSTASAYNNAQDFINSVADALYEQSKSTGVQLVEDGEGGKRRTSTNDPFYRDYYQENKKRPTKKAYREEVKRQLERGGGNLVGADEVSVFQLIQDRQFGNEQIVHTMPDGSKMAGPEHEGAVPGSTIRVRTDQKTMPATADQQQSGQQTKDQNQVLRVSENTAKSNKVRVSRTSDSTQDTQSSLANNTMNPGMMVDPQSDELVRIVTDQAASSGSQKSIDKLVAAIKGDDALTKAAKKAQTEGKELHFYAKTDANNRSVGIEEFDPKQHAIEAGFVTDINGSKLGNHIKVDITGIQVNVGGQLVNLESIVGNPQDWAGDYRVTETMDRNLMRLAPNENAYRKTRRFLIDHKIQSEDVFRQELRSMRQTLRNTNKQVLNAKPKSVSDKQYKEDIFDYIENNIDEGRLAQRYSPETIQVISQYKNETRKLYDSLIERVNEVFGRFGEAPVDYRQDYLTHINELSNKPSFAGEIYGRLENSFLGEGRQTTRGSVPGDIAGRTENFRPGKRWNRFFQQRKGGEFTKDPFLAVDTYIEPTLYNIHMTESAVRARAIESLFRTAEYIRQRDVQFVGEQLQESLKDYTPTDNSKLVAGFQEFANALAGKTQRLDRQILDASETSALGLRAWQKLQRLGGASTVVGNASSTINQVLNQPLALAESGLTNYIKGIGSTIAKNTPIDQSPFISARQTRVDSDFRSGYEKFIDVGGMPLQFVELASVKHTWNAMYHKAISEGFKGRDAILEADRLTEQVVAGRGIADKPEVYRSTATNGLLQYTLEVSANNKKFWQDLNATQKAEYAVSTLVLNNLVGLITGYEPLPDFLGAAIDSITDFFDEDDKRSTAEKIAEGLKRQAGELVSMNPVGSAVANTLPESYRRGLFTEDSDLARFEGTAAPIKYVQTALDAGRGVVEGNWRAARDSTIRLAPMGNQAVKTLTGAETLMRGYGVNKAGDITYLAPTNPLGQAQTLLFGPNSSRQAQEYYDNDRRPLSSNQRDAFLSVVGDDQRNYYNNLQVARDYNRGLESGQPRQSTDAVKIKAETTQEYRGYLAAYGLEETKPQRTSEKFGDLIYTDDTISTARSIVKGTKAADMPEWVKLQWLEENGLTLDQVELDLAADLKVAQKANFLQSELQGMSEQQKIAALAPYLEETISGKYFASYGTLRELRDRGVITDRTYDAIYQATSGKTSSKKRSGGRSRGSSSKAISIARQALKPINLSTSAPQTVKISNPNIGTSAYRKARRNTINVV